MATGDCFRATTIGKSQEAWGKKKRKPKLVGLEPSEAAPMGAPHAALASAVARKPQAKGFFCDSYSKCWVPKCSTNNKNPETDIGVQPEDQRSKAASH